VIVMRCCAGPVGSRHSHEGTNSVTPAAACLHRIHMDYSEKPLVHCLDHVVLEIRDPERSTKFYQELLGFEPVRLDEFRRGTVKFPSVRVSASMLLDLFPPTMWRGTQPQNPNHICFVASHSGVTALRARLANFGIAITRTDDRNFGAQGFGHSIYFDDPDGVSIEVRYYEG
jgi:catechol 2,3-dioxygenase-like lactoylglutathione lyase family enzyme